MTSTEAASDEVVAHQLRADPAVATGKRFGRPCLEIGGTVLAAVEATASVAGAA